MVISSNGSGSDNITSDNQPNKKCDYCCELKKLLQDMPFLITILLITTFFVAFLIVMAFESELVKDIAAIWGAWIGSAIGYFFGSRPVDKLIEKMETVSELAEKYLEDLNESKKKYNQAISDFNASKQSYEEYINKFQQEAVSHRKAINEINNIVNNYSNILPNDLVERLKSEYSV